MAKATNYVNGSAFKNAIINGAYAIAAKKREVDELNVYPVPDGDTGTNMSMTMNATLKELQFADDNSAVSQIADTVAAALLRGARGNSGVILSLLFRGFSKGFKGKTNASCEDFVNSLKLGVEGAYKAVMTPTEGTILTVARVAYENAAKAEYSDITKLWSDILDTANDTLEKTPEMLPILKKAGVVDAGGMGLIVIWEAMLDIFNGGEITKPQNQAETQKQEITGTSTVVGDFDEEITFGYCTEYIVNKTAAARDSSSLRAFLETIGDSVVCVDDGEIIKVHVHTDHPGKAIEEGLLFGSLVNMKIDNMRYQHENKIKEAALLKEEKFTPVRPEKKFGFVTVATGAGLEEMFKNLGVDQIVRGGQTMNPSTNDILKAIYMTPAETVFILPNNKNIIMTAEQTVKLADRGVCVLPTRTIPQGMSAMLAFDSTADFEDNRLNMNKALENVSTGLVTFAARDSDFNGHNIKQGEILALENGKLAFSEKDVNKAAYKLVKKMVKSTSGFVTIIYGSDIADETAEELYGKVNEKYGGNAEIMLLNGGQPVYYYIVSVE